MNVGSILNNDSPPSDSELAAKPLSPSKPPSSSLASSDPIRPDFPTHQRHSINNLLNDQPQSRSKPSPVQPMATFHQPFSQPSSNPSQNRLMSKSPTSLSPTNEYKAPKAAASPSFNHQRSSIADITNDNDVDIDTGKETANISRQPSLSSSVQRSPEPEEIKQPKPEPKLANDVPNTDAKKANDVSKTEPQESKAEPKNAKEVKPLPPSTKRPGRRKPRRYSKPPIWAQEWYPGFKSNGSVLLEPSSFDSQGPIQTTYLSDKPVFDRNTTSSVDLECSITNTIPPPSVVRTIAEWVYANFVEIPVANRKYVELELKFGTIMDKSVGRRLDINVSTECIYTNTSAIYFDAGVHEVGWNDMKVFLEDLEKQYQEDLKKNAKDKPKRKFATLETDITDQIFQITQRGETPKSIRVSKDNTLEPPRYLAIHKQRISDLYIHNPSSMYDLRLSLSFEHPVPEGSIEPILKNNKPALTRMKKRSSWNHRPTVTKFDLTRVLVPKETKTKSGKLQVEHDQSFEAELEIDTIELFSGFDRFRDGNDNIRFEELVEIFMNNARCLNNRVTKLASGGR